MDKPRFKLNQELIQINTQTAVWVKGVFCAEEEWAYMLSNSEEMIPESQVEQNYKIARRMDEAWPPIS